MSSIPTATASQLGQILYANIVADIATLMLGSPGLGKTSVPRAVFSKLADRWPGGFYCVSTREYNPIEIGGLWYTGADGLTHRAPSTVIPLDLPVFVLIDEISDCLPFEQSSWYRLLLERTIGDRPLATGSYVCAAGNRADDNAAARELSTAILGRCNIVTVRASWEVTREYAINNGWHPTVCAFLSAFGADAIDNGFNPSCPYGGATPRDFERISKLENANAFSRNSETALLQAVGNVGPIIGAKYHAFRSLPIPSPQLVFDNPQTAPTELTANDKTLGNCNDSALLLYCAAILGAMQPTEPHYKAVTDYALRLDRVQGYGLFWDTAKRFPAFKNSPQFARGAITYKNMAFSS